MIEQSWSRLYNKTGVKLLLGGPGQPSPSLFAVVLQQGKPVLGLEAVARRVGSPMRFQGRDATLGVPLVGLTWPDPTHPQPLPAFTASTPGLFQFQPTVHSVSYSRHLPVRMHSSRPLIKKSSSVSEDSTTFTGSVCEHVSRSQMPTSSFRFTCCHLG